MSTDAYLFVNPIDAGGPVGLTELRGYVMADAQARCRRMCGESVLLALGIDDLASAPEGEDAGARIEGLRRELAQLGLSFDPGHELLTGTPEFYGWSQRLFVALMEADLVYRRGGGAWYLRSGRFNEENDRRVDELEGWDKAARKAQRRLLKRVDGFELEGKALDGTPLTLFTSHPNEISAAEFVAISPSRPELDAWLADESARSQIEKQRTGDWTGKSLEELPAIDIGMSVQVPGVPAPLPILVSPAVDLRFGPTAVLGIPGADDDDKAMARKLPKAGGLAWKVESKPPKTTAAARYLTDDMPLSTDLSQGAPLPVVQCDKCGVVPLAPEELPLSPDSTVDRECPGCGGRAVRDGHDVHPRLHRAWLEIALAVPAAERGESLFADAGLAQALPTAQSVAPDTASLAMLDMRTIAKALRDVGLLTTLDDGEPHGPTLMHAAIEVEGHPDATALVRSHSADGVRFALLHVAAPAKELEADEDLLARAASALSALRAFAEPRLGSAEHGSRIDASDGLRRRLASWCDTAVSRVLENYRSLETHRATRNVIELRKRIEDFESRVTDYRGEVAGADAEAVAVATRALVGLLAPIAPGVATELLGDGDAAASWPVAQREPMPA